MTIIKDRMLALEKGVIAFIEKHFDQLFLGIILLLAVVVRMATWRHESWDYQGCFKEWYLHFESYGGLPGLRYRVGDYPLLYQTLIALMVYIPLPDLLLYKLISYVFDFSLAFAVPALVGAFKEGLSVKTRNLLVAAVLFFPTVLWDSALWGQCDSIYTSLLLWTVVYLVKGKNHKAFLLLGVAFSFKQQAIFLLPFLLIWYMVKRSYSLYEFFIVPIVVMISCIPCSFFGRSPFATFGIFLKQIDENGIIGVNIANFWMLAGGNYEINGTTALLITIALFGGAMYYLYHKKIDLTDRENVFLLLTWTVWTAVMFLPGMHERYTYMVDILLMTMTVMKPKKYWLIAALEVGVSLKTYAYYLFSVNRDLHVLAPFAIVAYGLFSVLFVLKMQEKISE